MNIKPPSKFPILCPPSSFLSTLALNGRGIPIELKNPELYSFESIF